jgi:acyl-coenzyme A synthetase/AMP-(fatty) acid ligase
MMHSDQMTIREMIHRSARWFPTNEAAVDEVTRLTYAQLVQNAERCAALYHELGVRKYDRVALLTYPSAIHTVAVFGAIELGALPVALHIRESVGTLSEVLRKLSPRILVYDAALEPTAQELLRRCPYITASVRAHSAVPAQPVQDAAAAYDIPKDLEQFTLDFEPMPVYEHDPVAIVLSSGTTNIPKGIVHTNRTFIESARGGPYFFQGIKPSDSILNILSTSFIGWYNLSLPFFNVGAKVVFLSRWDPIKYLDTVERERITIVFLIPTMWRLLFKAGVEGRDLRSVRLAGFAGEVMDLATLERIRKQICPHVINVYGTTETGSCSAGTVMFEEDMTPERLASVGKPLLNADIRVIRPGGTSEDVLPPGESGEVIIRGPSVASSVWDDAATARKIFEGPYPWWHSGDYGHLDEQGFLYLEGRLDDMIISGGINIPPARVEEALLQHPDVAECAVIGVPDPDWGQRIKAFVVLKRPGLTEAELDAFLRQSDLSPYQRPREYEFVTDLPRTSTGKVNRKALREAEARKVEAAADSHKKQA